MTEELQQEFMTVPQLLIAMNDMQEGMHPDLEFDKVSGSFSKYSDYKIRAILTKYMKSEVENRTSNKEAIARMLVQNIDVEDESTLRSLLETIYHLPFRNIAIILKDMNSEINNSLMMKTRSKPLVV